MYTTSPMYVAMVYCTVDLQGKLEEGCQEIPDGGESSPCILYSGGVLFNCRNAYLVQKIEQIFGNISDLHELSVQLFGMVEDCLEMVSDSEGEQQGKCPQLGACFAELALVSPLRYSILQSGYRECYLSPL